VFGKTLAYFAASSRTEDKKVYNTGFRMTPTHSVVQLAATGSQGNTAASLPQLWTNQGHGQVQILPPLPLENPCQSNCSAFGASCVILDAEAKKLSCLCPNGKILDAFNPKCSDGEWAVLKITISLMIIKGILFLNVSAKIFRC
jgi:hypothetical protein